MTKKVFIFCAIFFILLFLLFAFRSLSLPGIWYDEALQLVPTLMLLNDAGSFHFHGNSFVCSVGGKTFPLMTLNYLGALKSYCYLPFYLILGVNPLSVRLGGILAGVIVLVFTYMITRKLFGPVAALISLALLSVDPSFVLFFRMDSGPVAIQTVLKVLSFWFLLLWLEKNRLIYLGAGFFCLGLGLYDKANFVIYIFALGISFPLFCRKRIIFLLKMKYIIIGGLLFSLGCAPLLIQEIQSGGSLLNPLVNPFVKDSSYLTTWMGWQGSLLLLERTLNGLWIQHFISHTVAHVSWFPYLCLACLGLAGVLVVRLRKSKDGYLKRILAILFLTVVIWVVITIIPATWGAHHYMMLYPFPQIFCASVLALAWRREYYSRWKKFFISAAVVSVLIVLYTSVLSLHGHYRNMEKGVFAPRWSPAISTLTDYLVELSPREIICVDWGLHNSIVLLSDGKLNSREIYWNLNDRGEEYFRKEVETLFERDGVVFVVFSPPPKFAAQAVDIFREMLENRKPGSFSKKEIPGPNGLPVYQIYGKQL